MIRDPDFANDGWHLLSAEDRHAAHPDSFHIPNEHERRSLTPGDMAQLLFEISFDDPEDPASVERMWVYVTESEAGSYIGVLINRPRLIPENDSLWEGAELPFRAEHVMSWVAGDGSALPVKQRTSWPRA